MKQLRGLALAVLRGHARHIGPKPTRRVHAVLARGGIFSYVLERLQPLIVTTPPVQPRDPSSRLYTLQSQACRETNSNPLLFPS
jgi:hypothetical protein